MEIDLSNLWQRLKFGRGALGVGKGPKVKFTGSSIWEKEVIKRKVKD